MPTPNPTLHPLADILHAFADGKIIQYKSAYGSDLSWLTLNKNSGEAIVLLISANKDLHWRIKPEKKVGWINIYARDDNNYAYLHNTRADADGTKAKNRIACIKIEFTEGEGL